jgi:Ca2+-binding RTX toxin-like protein
VSTAAQLANNDIEGTSGQDTLRLSEATTYADSAFANVSNIDALVLATIGFNTVTFDSNADAAGFTSLIGGNGVSTYNILAGFDNALTLVGGINADNVDASAYTSDLTFIATSGGSDIFVGGSGNDDVLFATLTVNQNVDGGTGAADTIRFSAAVTLADAAFTNVANIDQVIFADATNSITINTAVAAAGVQTLTGGTGADSFTKTDATVMTLVGGAGNDVFTFSTAAIFAADSIAGGANNDTIVLSEDAVTLNDADFDRILSVESFTTANGDNDLTLGSNADNVAGILTVTGGTGNDDIDASAYDSAVTLNGGSGGSDTLIGGSGADRLKAWSTSGLASTNAFNDTLTGGSGADVFVLGDTASNAYGQGAMGDISNYRAAITDFNADADIFELFRNGATGNFVNNGTNLISIKNSGNTADVYRLAYNDTSHVASLYQLDGAGGLLGIATVNTYTGTFADSTVANFNLVG